MGWRRSRAWESKAPFAHRDVYLRIYYLHQYTRSCTQCMYVCMYVHSPNRYINNMGHERKLMWLMISNDSYILTRLRNFVFLKKICFTIKLEILLKRLVLVCLSLIFSPSLEVIHTVYAKREIHITINGKRLYCRFKINNNEWANFNLQYILCIIFY